MKNKGTVKIETDRLILRRFEETDAEAMFANWASDPEVTKYLTWPPHGDVNETKEIIAEWISQYEDPTCYNWGIELKQTHDLVGSISVVRLNDAVDSADLGYCMGKRWWGQGIMPEAVKALISFLFHEVGVNRVAASHDVNNPKSGRVMEKSGMKTEGIWRAAGLNNQGICDEVWHAIVRQDLKVS